MRTTGLVLGLCVFASAQAFALPKFMDFHKIAEKARGPQTTSSKVVEECANFSGNWAGMCKDEDGEEATSFTIEQKNCSLMVIDDSFSITFGGIKSDGATTQQFTYGSGESADWIENGQKMVFRVGGGGRTLGKYSFFHFHSKIFLYLENDMLKLDMENGGSHETEEGVQTSASKGNCILSRK